MKKGAKAKGSPKSGGDALAALPIFGRPVKAIDREVIRRMCEALRVAGTVEQAAMVADVSPSHFFSWQARARANVAGGTATQEEAEFLEALKAAKQHRGLTLEAMVYKQAETDGKLAVQALERLPETRERWRPPRVDVVVRGELEAVAGRLEHAFAQEPELLERIFAVMAEEAGAVQAEGARAEGEDASPAVADEGPARPAAPE